MAKIATRLFSKRGTARDNRRPLMLGVVGDSGCGKSTLVRGLLHLFGRGCVTEICLDDYHRYDRVERARRGLTALHPDANNLELMTEHLARLREGQRILKPVYDHSTGRFAHPEAVLPRSVVIVHGLLTFANPELFDLRVYLDPEETLRLEWKIARDTLKRGYQVEEVLRQIEERRPDAIAYIQPQKAVADLVVGFRRPVSLLNTDSRLDVRLSPCAGWEWPRLQPEAVARWLTIPPGQALEISGRVEKAAAERLARSFIQPSASSPLSLSLDQRQPLKGLGLYHRNATRQPAAAQSLPLALSQLLIAARLAEAGQPALLQQNRVA